MEVAHAHENNIKRLEKAYDARMRRQRKAAAVAAAAVAAQQQQVSGSVTTVSPVLCECSVAGCNELGQRNSTQHELIGRARAKCVDT